MQTEKALLRINLRERGRRATANGPSAENACLIPLNYSLKYMLHETNPLKKRQEKLTVY